MTDTLLKIREVVAFWKTEKRANAFNILDDIASILAAPEGEAPVVPAIDLDSLATRLQQEIKERDISERAAAREMGIGAATLGRMLDGSAAPHTPDLASVQKATAWIASGQAEPSADAKDAARWRALRANTGNEIDLSSGPGSAKAMVIRINVEGCEKWLESGTPDIPATLDAAMDDEVRIQADAARAALSQGESK